MSLALKVFTENFLRGMELGNRWQDKAADREYKRQALGLQLQKMQETAQMNRARLADSMRRTGGYLQGIEAKSALDRAKAANVGKGGGGGGVAPGLGQLYSEFGENAPAPQAPRSVVQGSDDSAAVPTPPSSDWGGGGGDDSGDGTYQHGGRVPFKRNSVALRTTRPMRQAQYAPSPQRAPAGAGPAPSAGTAGPGSGMGDVAAPPVDLQTQMRQGGRVPRFAEGGVVYPDPNLQPDPRYARPMTEEEQRIRVENPDAGRADVPYERGGERPRSDRTFRNPKPPDYSGEQLPPAYYQDPMTYIPYPEQKDSAPAPQPYEPGASGPLPSDVNKDYDTGQSQPPQGGDVMPPVTVTAPRQGVRTGTPQRLLLGDQRRTAAYDPTLDAADPRNTQIVDASGRVNPRVYQASAAVHPEAYKDNVGMFGERLDRPGPQPVPAYDGTGGSYAMQGAARWAEGQHPQVLYGQHSVVSPKEVHNAFQVADPDNKLPLHQKMIASAQAAHDFWMSQPGDPAENQKRADEAAGQITQFGVKMSQQHAMKAMKMLQSGDTQGATNELMAGYGWLPDGGTPEVQNGGIVIRNDDGSVKLTMPINPKTLSNVALGMATGRLGWDVMGVKGGQPPTSAPPQSRPAAPPQAAPAGPSAPPPAAPAVQPAPSARTQGPQMGPEGPATTTPAQTQPPGGAPSSGTQTGPTAIQTAAPPATSAPARTPVPTAGASAPAPSQPPSATGQGPSLPPQGGGEQRQPTQRTEADDQQEHFDKHPNQPYPEGPRADDPQIAKRKQDRERQFAKEQTDILRRANELGLMGKKGSVPSSVSQLISTRRQRLNADLKDLDREQAQIDAEHRQANLPRRAGLTEEAALTAKGGTFEQQANTIANAPADSKIGRMRQNSVLRYAGPDDRETVNEIATNIWRNNQGISSHRAYELALTATSIMPPTAEDKDPVGLNRQKGDRATRFMPIRRGRDTILRFSDGTEARVDRDTHQQIVNQHEANWQQWKEKGEKDAAAAAASKKNALSLKTLGAGLRTMAPYTMPGANLLLEGTGRLLEGR